MAATGKTLVAIVMGSKSDWEVMQHAPETLTELGIGHEVRVTSAHRTPDATMKYASELADRGIELVIAAAGGAAHLAGVMAAKTALPVLGVPLVSGTLNGLDALLSTVQMPGGVPVATFGVGAGGPVNAALFAARILAVGDAGLAARLEKVRDDQREKVLEKDAKLRARKG